MEKINKETLLKRVIEISAICCLIICILGIPNVANIAAIQNPSYAKFKFPISIFVYITVIPFFLGLSELYKICNLIKEDESFSKKSIKALKNIRDRKSVV